MNYTLAKELKDAGFPQEYKKSEIAMDWVYNSIGELIMLHKDNDTNWWLGQDYDIQFTEEILKKEYVKCPTLSELIEACLELIPDKFLDISSRGYREKQWVATSCLKITSGKTLIEALARLWLALNNK